MDSELVGEVKKVSLACQKVLLPPQNICNGSDHDSSASPDLTSSTSDSASDSNSDSDDDSNCDVDDSNCDDDDPNCDDDDSLFNKFDRLGIQA